MRGIGVVMVSGALLGIASPAFAAEALKFGPAPAWVQPAAIPDAKPTEAPYMILLSDQQMRFDQGKTTTYGESAIQIQTPQGLAAGNISFSWDPATDSVTVNTLQIRRGDKVIDVLGAGQTFTVLRRESNLEAAMLDGTLTANIQPEGLQQGDIVVLGVTNEHLDPVWKGHVEATFAEWNDQQLEYARARLTWPSELKMRAAQSLQLPAAQRSRVGRDQLLELTGRQVQPLLAPKGAPVRFTVGRLAEVSDFSSWAEVADLFQPLYRAAATIPQSGPLRDELSRIRNSTSDPKARAEQALALVQDRIRYVALGMGQGGYVPAAAETTWSRRFGDCKGKTALLLGLLAELGIEAEPVFVNTALGDAIADRLPMIGVFNHVLVRARIAGKDHWLDGTRTGDARLDDIRVPAFGWVLPVARSASLVHLVPPPLAVPETETRADINAADGIHAPAPATVEKILRGDVAVALQTGLSALTDAQRDEFFRHYLKQEFDLITFKSASMAFDKTKRELRITTVGEAKFDWTDGYFHVPDSTVGYTPDFDRPAGPLHDAPMAVAYPEFGQTEVKIHVPASFLAGRRLGSGSVHETLAGIEYSRTATVDGDMLVIKTSERSLVPEIPYKDALAAAARLKALADEDVSLPLSGRYRPTAKDLVAIAADRPASKAQFINRGLTFLDTGEYDKAIDDFTQALALDPKDPWALADRAIARVWKQDFAAAAKDLAAAEAADPNNAVIPRVKALTAEIKGDFKTAASFYSTALEREPNNSFALGHRAMAYRALGDNDKALADSERALKANPGFADLRLMRANILLAQGKRDAVAVEAERLVAENPQSDLALVGAGKIYARIGRLPEAMKAFDQALAIKPAAYIYINRAQVRPRSDRAGRLADLEQSLKLDPDNPDALAETAELVAASGDFKQAAALYERAAKDAPDNSPLKVERAVALYQAGRTAEAQKALATFATGAKTANDFNTLCWRKATSGILLESALADCRKAVKLAPDNGAYLDSLGFVLLRLGKLDESITAYTAAIGKRSQSPSLMGRAIAFARKGDRTHAETDRTDALKLDPDAETRFAEYGVKF